MNTGGDFFTGNFPDKGCFTKYEHGYYGTGGNDDEIAAIDLHGTLITWVTPASPPLNNAFCLGS